MAPSQTVDSPVVVPGFIDRRFARMLYNMLRLREHRGEGRRDDHMPTELSFWGDSTLDAFHLAVRREVEATAGGPLLPTYCYARLYTHGATLHAHHDREACEIVATIHVGHRGAPPPPICFASGHSVLQEPGDAVIFCGAVEHWRDMFRGEDFGQVFLNFVRADGPYRHLLLDGRHQSFPPSFVLHVAGPTADSA